MYEVNRYKNSGGAKIAFYVLCGHWCDALLWSSSDGPNQCTSCRSHCWGYFLVVAKRGRRSQLSLENTVKNATMTSQHSQASLKFHEFFISKIITGFLCPELSPFDIQSNCIGFNNLSNGDTSQISTLFPPEGCKFC